MDHLVFTQSFCMAAEDNAGKLDWGPGEDLMDHIRETAPRVCTTGSPSWSGITAHQQPLCGNMNQVLKSSFIDRLYVSGQAPCEPVGCQP